MTSIKYYDVLFLSLVALLYFAVATGLSLPERFGLELWFGYVVSFLVVLVSVSLLLNEKLSKKFLFFLFFLFLVFLIYLTLNFFRLSQSVLIGSILGFVVPFFVSINMHLLSRRIGLQRFFDFWLMVGFLVLLMTFFYKVFFGFGDRSVRFFMNGPIVFGWLNSFLALLCFYKMQQGYRFFYALGLTLSVMAVLWTLSKGPLLALVAGMSVLLFHGVRKVSLGGKLLYFSLVVLVFFGFLFFIEGTRLSSFVSEIFTGDVLLVFNNSSRAELWREAVSLISSSPIVGYGPDYFYYKYENSIVTYPHNWVLGLLLDGGFVLFVSFLLFVIALFFASNCLSRALLVSGGVGLLFSGDVQYLRFLFLMPLSFVGVCEGKNK